MRTHRLRRLTALATVTGLLALLPVVSLAAPSQADAGCLTEAASGLGSSRCDDSNPPETTFLAADPTANANGYLTVDHVAISFTGSYSDADADPIAYQCQFYDTATAPTAWTTCTSPVSYTGLDDTGAVPYTFNVRAVDTGDNAIDATASGGLLGPKAAATDVPDLDATPATTSFFVDTVAPNTFVFDEPFDQFTPDHPMITTADLTLDLESSEDDVTYVCTLSGVRTPCHGGTTTITGLTPGNQVLTVTTVDPAGNVDTTPTSTPFSVPRNLVASMGRGFTRVASTGGFFAGDVLRATTRTATLSVHATRAKEMRVLAPSADFLGTIQVRQGQQPWVTLKQSSKRPRVIGVAYQKYFGRAFTGTLSFRVTRASASKPALLDAILLH